MKAEIQSEYVIHLHVLEQEARWLCAFMQNPPNDTKENLTDATMRRTYFDTLRYVLKELESDAKLNYI